MPRRRNETAEEYYIRMKNEAYEAKQEYNKEQRHKRNELIKNAGKLFVDKCKFDDLNDYTNICESVDFYNIVIAYIKSKSAPQTEATAGCEVNADVPEVNTSYGTESII